VYSGYELAEDANGTGTALAGIAKYCEILRFRDVAAGLKSPQEIL